MKPKNKYRYELTDRLGTVDVDILGEGGFSIEYEAETDDKYYYSQQFQGKLTFTGEIYERLKFILNSIYICAEHRLKIFRPCGASEILIFDGFFNLLDGDWDDDKCALVVKFKKTSPFKCLVDNRNKKLNLLSIPDKITVKGTTSGGTFEFLLFTEDYPTIQSPYSPHGYYWQGTGTPADGNWLVMEHNETGTAHYNSSDPYYGTTYSAERTTQWVREVISIPSADVPPADWVLIQDNTAVDGTKKYAKKASLFNCQQSSYENSYGEFSVFERCLVAGAGQTGGESFDNGMRLKDVLELFVSDHCAPVSVVSDFFQINPENPSTINYVTEEETFVDRLVLFQKSDVKRPNVSGNATKAEWTFEKLMETLNKMFNVSYTIDGGVLRIEHVSWFSREIGFNLTTPEFAKWVAGKKKYSFDSSKMPAQELFRFKEVYNEAWNSEISYDGFCANNGGIDNISVEQLTTDVQYCLENSSSDSDKVEDAGFVLMATENSGGFNYIITDFATENARFNNVLSFDNLVRKFHFYNRPLKSGEVKGVPIVFETTRPIKQGEDITIPFCCETVFDPNDKILTPLGEGIVSKAEFNLRNETLKLELLYDVFGGLTENDAPVFVKEDLYNTAPGTPIDIPVVVTDDGTIIDVWISSPPMFGTATLNGSVLTFSPASGVTGTSRITLSAKDNFGEVTIAVYNISVL